MCASVQMMFPRHLWYDFNQTFVISASWDRDELIRLWSQNIKSQGHSVTKCTKNTIFMVCFYDIPGVHMDFLQSYVTRAS